MNDDQNTRGFQARRTVHEFTQINFASPEQVFPLLCPVREAEWVPGWQYRMICSQSGVAERGCVFATPNPDSSETVWVVTDYDPAACRIAFVWVHPGMVATEIQIQLHAEGDGRTRAEIRYSYTGLSEAGNAEIERYDEAWFRQKMTSWEKAINHYLEQGEMIGAGAWE